MRLIKAELGNFGSYEHLEFNFDRPGLTLIQGLTGSGKSTLFDAPAWILYGITAKDGSVDDVRSWNDLTLPTIGVLTVESKGEKLTITRIRGKSNENDLYFTKEDSETEYRGTNIKETQTLLDTLLGVDGSTYLAAAYFCEYSPSSTFFVSNSTQRRILFDRISNLAFPTTLAAHLSDKISESKKVFLKSQNDIVSLKRQLTLIENNLKDSHHRSKDWEVSFVNRIEKLKDQSINFTEDRKTLITGFTERRDEYEHERQEELAAAVASLATSLSFKTCPSCGGDTTIDFSTHIQKDIDRIKHRENPYTYRLEEASKSTNGAEEQLEYHLKQVNPFKDQIDHFESQRKSINMNLKDEEKEYVSLKAIVEEYEHLKALTGELKEQLLTRSVESIQELTNSHLTKHFDGELSVNFGISGPNALDIIIFKNGHEAVYKQLSKGQRQLLKLSFSIAVMAVVANRSGVHFNSLFFDEALDGLDTQLKVKAFSLFQSLEANHGSIFVIDHAEEFKNLFSQRYVVSINADVSTLIYEQP